MHPGAKIQIAIQLHTLNVDYSLIAIFRFRCHDNDIGTVVYDVVTYDWQKPTASMSPARRSAWHSSVYCAFGRKIRKPLLWVLQFFLVTRPGPILSMSSQTVDRLIYCCCRSRFSCRARDSRAHMKIAFLPLGCCGACVSRHHTALRCATVGQEMIDLLRENGSREQRYTGHGYSLVATRLGRT